MIRSGKRVRRGGVTLTERVWAIVEAVEAATGLDLSVTQGSYNAGAVEASSGTHDGGGALDLSVRGLSRTQRLAVVWEFRRRGCAAWLRTSEFGWAGSQHIHVIVSDETGLAYGARRQVANFLARLNGLASKRRDPHKRPVVVPFPSWPLPVVSIAAVQPGKRSPDARIVQKALAAEVGLRYKVPGLMGARTVKAYRAWQTKLGYTGTAADGTPGRVSLTALGRRWGFRVVP